MKFFYLALLGSLALSGLTGCSSKSGCSQYSDVESCATNSCFWTGFTCESTADVKCASITNQTICTTTVDRDGGYCTWSADACSKAAQCSDVQNGELCNLSVFGTPAVGCNWTGSGCAPIMNCHQAQNANSCVLTNAAGTNLCAFNTTTNLCDVSAQSTAACSSVNDQATCIASYQATPTKTPCNWTGTACAAGSCGQTTVPAGAVCTAAGCNWTPTNAVNTCKTVPASCSYFSKTKTCCPSGSQSCATTDPACQLDPGWFYNGCKSAPAASYSCTLNTAGDACCSSGTSCTSTSAGCDIVRPAPGIGGTCS